MGKPLQKVTFSVLSFFLAFFTLYAPAAHTQVAIQDERGLEIVFSASGSLTQTQLIQLTPDDLSRFFNTDRAKSVSEWDNRSDQAGIFYVQDGNEEFGIGGIVPENSPAERLFYLNLQNRTSSQFAGLQIAFDFIYQSSPENSNYSLQLRYRIGNQSWTDVPGATVSSSMLKDNIRNWNTFSIQTSLDGILLNRDETIEFEWVETTNSMDVQDIPVAFQQIGFFPDTFSPEMIQRGDLIVSEILPSTDIRGRSIEFIEIYNPTESVKNLKGLELRTQTGSFFVRSDFEIAPHSFGVMLSEESSQVLETEFAHRYSGTLLPDNNGYVELYMDGRELAKAMFERTDSDRSLELNRIANAFDGYSSLQHFRPSNTVLTGSVSATPGRDGNTQKLYSKDLNESGWHFLTPPGLLDERLSRLNPQQIRTLKAGENISTDIDPNEPVLIYFDSERERRIYSNQTVQTAPEEGYSIRGTTAKAISAPGDKPFKLRNLTNEAGQRVSPVYLSWNNSEQRFQLLYDGETEVSRWNPLIVHESAEIPSTGTADRRRGQQGVQLDRMISFTLSELTRDGSRNQLDQSVVGFLREIRGQSGKRYDLPKLLPISADETVVSDLNKLHIASSAASNRANSFVHLPYELDQEYQFNLGVTSTDRTYQAVLDWSEAEDIPDEWMLTLVDHLTGREIDMKEQTSYEFRLNMADNGFKEKVMEPGTIVPFNPTEEERFTVTMKPFESAIGMSEEAERPGSVELRQNYPNPFNPSTNIVFYLPEQQPVKIGVYNIVGQQVALLADESLGAGEHVISWNASEMPSGVYIVQLEVGSRIFTRKITLIK